ncbi:MAG: hypothetical protein KDI88_18940, partial [Gammaproteobacteria bacterium]|nr:hypothetical protein [Gammaproteobacteria bacterium]
KRAKFSPFFGPLPAPNTLYSYDIDIGNAQAGMTLVCDTYQVITPVMGTIPIPFLADTSPYFDRLCTDLRLAGFGIHVELRRPFPHPSPLMIFELMGFLSDPSLPIDPAGHLAELMWAEIRDGRVSLPPAVLGLFPSAGAVVNRQLDARVNVGTVIGLAQQLATTANDLWSRLAQGGSDIADVINALSSDPPLLDAEALLDLLPPSLRRIELQGAFVGFAADATFLLISPRRLATPDTPADDPAGDPLLPGPVRWDTVVAERFDDTSLSGWRVVDHGLKRGRGAWSVEQGMLVQHNNVGDNSPGRYGAMLVRETGALSDIRVSVTMHSSDNDGMGVVFHVQGNTTFYRFRMTAEQHAWQLMRLKRGRTRTLQSTPTAFIQDTDYRVVIEARSVPQAAMSLPRAVGRNTLAIDLATGPGGAGANRRATERYATLIRVWVNGTLWCDIVDSDKPLTGGEVGLDSWWNRGARYDDFVIEQAERGHASLSLDAAARLSRDLVPLTGRERPATDPTAATWVDDALAAFSDADRQAALGDTGDAPGNPAVVVAARVQLLASQIYRFLGVMRADGSFSLLSRVGVTPLTLSVAGIRIPLQLDVQGRLLLEGRADGAGSWARVSAALHGQWVLVPPGGGAGGPALAELHIGSETAPVALALDSRGGFHLAGDGQLRLFGGQVIIDGALDVSDRHAAFDGHFAFAPNWFAGGQQRVLDLALDVAGQLGPGRRFLLAGDGSLQLFGRACSDVRGELSQDGVRLEARLAHETGGWNINGYALDNAALQLRGELRFGDSGPDLRLEGSGHLQWRGLHVEGAGRVSASVAGWCIGLGGALRWQGQDWLQGMVELCNDHLTVQGQTRFALNLTPTQLPANIQVAGLYLVASIGGSFTVRSSGRLKACAMSVDWTLAIRLPGGHAQQALPIATQRLAIEREQINSAASVKLADLINIDGWNLLPLDGVTIPVPQLSGDSIDLYLHDAVPIEPP